MSKLLFFLLSFFKVYFCQLLITSYSKKIMREKLIEMYKYIFLEYSFESLYNSEFNDIEYNNTKLSDIEVNNFNVTDIGSMTNSNVVVDVAVILVEPS